MSREELSKTLPKENRQMRTALGFSLLCSARKSARGTAKKKSQTQQNHWKARELAAPVTSREGVTTNKTAESLWGEHQHSHSPAPILFLPRRGLSGEDKPKAFRLIPHTAQDRSKCPT